MSPSTQSLAELRALSDLIKVSIGNIEKSLIARNQTFPSPDEAFDPSTEAARMAPDVLAHINSIVAAAAQLTAAVRLPAVSLGFIAGQVRGRSLLN